MKRALLFACLCAGLASTVRSFAATHIIHVADFQFSPATLTLPLGDTIKFMWMSGSHTTTSTTLPGGAASWDQDMTNANDSLVYVPTVAGTYNYKCKPHESMGMVGSFIVSPVNGISDLSATGFSIAPNPAHGSLRIESKETVHAVQILDISGRVRQQQPAIHQKSFTMPLDGVTPGIYMLRLQTPSGFVAQRLIIE